MEVDLKILVTEKFVFDNLPASFWIFLLAPSEAKNIIIHYTDLFPINFSM